jgi:hypothetical protein
MVHFTKCFQQWNNHWACWMKPQRDHFDGDKTDQKLRIVLKENYNQSGNCLITPCLLHILFCHIKLFRGRLQSDSKLVILNFFWILWCKIYIWTILYLFGQENTVLTNAVLTYDYYNSSQLLHNSSKLQKFIYTILQNIVNELCMSCSSY